MEKMQQTASKGLDMVYFKKKSQSCYPDQKSIELGSCNTKNKTSENCIIIWQNAGIFARYQSLRFSAPLAVYPQSFVLIDDFILVKTFPKSRFKSGESCNQSTGAKKIIIKAADFTGILIQTESNCKRA